MANPGMPEPLPELESIPDHRIPSERPLGSDEPSAPFAESPGADPAEPRIGPGDLPREPAEPGLRV